MGRYKMKVALTSVLVAVVAGVFLMGAASGEKSKEPVSSYSPVVIKENFATIMDRMKAEKPKIMDRQMELLNKRYDLSDRPAKGVTMSQGKAVQEGVRAKLPAGHDLGKAGRHEPGGHQGQGAVAGGVSAAAASQSPRRRHALSQVSHRRDQEAGRPRPDPVRPGLRSAGPFPAGISAARSF